MRLCIEIGGTFVRFAFADPSVISTAQLHGEGETEQQQPIAETHRVENKGIEFIIEQIQAKITETGVEVTSIGVASFGPLDLNKSSPTFGAVTRGACEAKQSWVNNSLALKQAEALGIGIENVFVDTDVNSACLAEGVFGGHKGVVPAEDNLAYITVGTGVGVGVVIQGVSVKGIQHPEGGHMV